MSTDDPFGDHMSRYPDHEIVVLDDKGGWRCITCENNRMSELDISHRWYPR